MILPWLLTLQAQLDDEQDVGQRAVDSMRDVLEEQHEQVKHTHCIRIRIAAVSS